MEDYLFYDSKLAVNARELQSLYRYTEWGHSRSVEGIQAMIDGTSLCFSARHDDKLVGFCRIITDFVYSASLLDVIVHPAHQGRGLGGALADYALTHPAIRNIPIVMAYTTGWMRFLRGRGFETQRGLMMLMRCPIEYS